jgi:hypothetical protein
MGHNDDVPRFSDIRTRCDAWAALPWDEPGGTLEDYKKLEKEAAAMADAAEQKDFTDILSEQIALKDARVAGGYKNDSDKTRIDLFPGDVLFAISDILTSGANTYTDRNWEEGMRWGRVFSALMRHMWAWWQSATPTVENFAFGDLDLDTGRSHLWHAGCCIVFLIAYEMRSIGEDDRP